MKTLSTHEYLALIFQDRSEVEAVVKGLQGILDREDDGDVYPAIQFHTANEHLDSTPIIKRLKYIFKDEIASKSIRQKSVWEESK